MLKSIKAIVTFVCIPCFVIIVICKIIIEKMENSSRIIQKGTTKKRHRSGECFCSCTAALVADCVALCCCPCAVFSFLSLTLFKAPWIVGRRCLGRGKKEQNCKKTGSGWENDMDGNSTSRSVARGISEIVVAGFEDEIGSKLEADGVSIELYQSSHLGFGLEIPSQNFSP